jgi:hypothetical protein
MGRTYKEQNTDKQVKLSKKEQGKQTKQFFKNWSSKA